MIDNIYIELISFLIYIIHGEKCESGNSFSLGGLLVNLILHSLFYNSGDLKTWFVTNVKG